jgi:hypothetical protein
LTVAAPLPAVAAAAVGAPGTVCGITPVAGADAGPVPAEFVAATLNEYKVPFVRPPTVIGLEEPVAVCPPGDALTVYELMGAPPSDEGGANTTVTCPSPAVVELIAGAPGSVRGVTAVDGDEASPDPAWFDAVTVNVYAIPLPNPVTTIGLDWPVAVLPPGDAVTVYEVIGAPPSDTGAANVTVALASPADAVTPVGAPGAVGAGVTAPEGAEAELVPTALVAVTVNVYGVPFWSPDTTTGLVAPVTLAPPGEAVTVNEFGALPTAPGVKLTVAWWLPGAADTPVGAPGAARTASPSGKPAPATKFCSTSVPSRFALPMLVSQGLLPP